MDVGSWCGTPRSCLSCWNPAWKKSNIACMLFLSFHVLICMKGKLSATLHVAYSNPHQGFVQSRSNHKVNGKKQKRTKIKLYSRTIALIHFSYLYLYLQHNFEDQLLYFQSYGLHDTYLHFDCWFYHSYLNPLWFALVLQLFS